MIVFAREGQLLFFTQPDHAGLAGALMNLWREDGLPDHPRRDEVLLAIREHDNGWREEDAAPRVHPESGRPLGFGELADADRIALWRRGVRRFATQTPYAALLILRHALQIHRDRPDSDDWEDFRATLAGLEQELLERSGGPLTAVADDYRLLELADTLSLGACGALGSYRSHESGSRSYRWEVELGRIGITPFPLAGATTLEITYRTLPQESFDSATELAAKLAVAPWSRMPIHIEPMDGG